MCICIPNPCGLTNPDATARKSNMNSRMDNPDLNVRACIIFSESMLLLCFIKWNNATPRLATMRIKAIITMIFIGIFKKSVFNRIPSILDDYVSYANRFKNKLFVDSCISAVYVKKKRLLLIFFVSINIV